VDDLAVLLGEALAIVYVPSQFAHHGVDEVDADARFVVIGRADVIGLLVEPVNEPLDRVRT